MDVAASKTSPVRQTHGKKVYINTFHLDDIPDAMRNMGWKVAPQLMEHWFSIKPAFRFTANNKQKILHEDANKLPASIVNNSIVTIKWAMGYSQVQEGISELAQKWDSPAGIKILKERLVAAGWPAKTFVYLGQSNSALTLDTTAQVNILTIGSYGDTINDWYGAMGNTTLKVAVRGFTTRINGRSSFIVEKVGFYLKDTYDFLSDHKWTWCSLSEPLGIWSKNGVLSKAESSVYMASYTQGLFGVLARKFSGYVPVSNHDFRAWQNKHNSGGDFLVFSDILWMSPQPGKEIIQL